MLQEDVSFGRESVISLTNGKLGAAIDRGSLRLFWKERELTREDGGRTPGEEMHQAAHRPSPPGAQGEPRDERDAPRSHQPDEEDQLVLDEHRLHDHGGGLIDTISRIEHHTRFSAFPMVCCLRHAEKTCIGNG